MNKHILVFGAGKSATALIEYLKSLLSSNNWTLTVADSNLELAASKTGKAEGTNAIAINVHDEESRSEIIRRADLVISLMPPSLHILIAKDCCRFSKHLLTASYVSNDMKQLEPEIEKKQLLFLCEMGLDPGIDHMSAMQIIDRLKAAGAAIQSFKSHCGGLVAPESDDNPWHYKISWNAGNVVKAGSTGAIFKEGGVEKKIDYSNLFNDCQSVNIPEIGKYAYYPNRDSLSYIPVYHLEEASDFLRTTLRHPAFCSGWNSIVRAGLTDEQPTIYPQHLSFRKWTAPVLPYMTIENKAQFEFLGFFDESAIPEGLHSSAAILQSLLEKNLMLAEKDRDMIIMLHELNYTINDRKNSLKSALIVKGEDNLHTAMAKTVGLPLGIAAKLLLQDKIQLRGLHLPVLKEIYEPVLDELAKKGIAFNESHVNWP